MSLNEISKYRLIRFTINQLNDDYVLHFDDYEEANACFLKSIESGDYDSVHMQEVDPTINPAIYDNVYKTVKSRENIITMSSLCNTMDDL